MQNKGKVIVLEDDLTLAQAMVQAFQKAGSDAVAVSRSDELKKLLNINDVQTVFIDCLLPSENGIDVAKDIRKNHPASRLDIVLMSGLFTDQHFVKDSVRQTQSLGFLKKPFSMPEALGYIKIKKTKAPEKVYLEEVSPRKNLYMLFGKNPVSLREKRKAIEALDELHGYDLPYLYSLLAETRSTGHLNIVSMDSDVSGVTFAEGNIVAVDVVDEGTFLGKLLLEGGFVLPDDLNTALNSTNPKRLGEKLISLNFLSPHGFLIAMENQMNIRLSRTIRDEKFKVNFVASDIAVSDPHIDIEDLGGFLHDWVASKISVDWLKSLYIQWSHFVIKKSSSFELNNPILKKPLISNFPGVLDHILSQRPVSQIVDATEYPQAALFKAIHLLITKGFITFEESAMQNEHGSYLRLKHIMDQFYDKNKFEIFDVIVKMVGSLNRNTEEVRNEFFQLLGPTPQTGVESVSLHEQITTLANEAFAFELGSNKDQLKEDLARNDVEQKLKASSMYEDAKNKLQKGQYTEALRILEKCLEMDSSLSKGRIYVSWARLAAKGSGPQKANVLKEVEVDMMQVPPEEKLEAIYSFVMGVYYKIKGDLGFAKKSFEKAVHLDGDLIVARRELNVLQNLESKNQKKNDVLSADLKDLVSNFFKKK